MAGERCQGGEGMWSSLVKAGIHVRGSRRKYRRRGEYPFALGRASCHRGMFPLVGNGSSSYQGVCSACLKRDYVKNFHFYRYGIAVLLVISFVPYFAISKLEQTASTRKAYARKISV